jgi:hypothetical protein
MGRVVLYINPDHHSKGIGQKVWQLIEEKYPEDNVHKIAHILKDRT